VLGSREKLVLEYLGCRYHHGPSYCKFCAAVQSFTC
jgi:hypothetical protein